MSPGDVSNGAMTAKAPNKRSFNEGKRHFKKNKRQKIDTKWPDGSNEDVLIKDVRALLEQHSLSNGEQDENGDSKALATPDTFTEVDVTVQEISSTGDGLAILPDSSRVVVIPFTTPGDKVTAKLIRHDPQHPFTVADFVKVIEPSKIRDDEAVECKYFAKCSGCQFQMMPYTDQLAHKRSVVEKAYKNFSGLPSSAVPRVGETEYSTKTYGYRTKLTPHFDGPPNGRKDRRQGNKPVWDAVPPIGFMQKGTRKTLDIEDCPIGTSAVRKGLKKERKRVAKDIDSYVRGATLLCREHTTAVDKEYPNDGLRSDSAKEVRESARSGSIPETKTPFPEDAIIEDDGIKFHVKTCITDQNAISTEYVLNKRFDNPAGAFFQNNNAILTPFLSYIRWHMLGLAPKDWTAPHNCVTPRYNPDGITHLVDAYSGSGLFTVSLSDMFEKSIGVDISEKSISFATKNAELNRVPKEKASFIAGDAKSIFAHVKDFPADRTVVVLDPSRKGCDQAFIDQLLEFGPKRICYVSCNVHTQARDVGVLCGEEKGKYEIEDLRGFDFFPQTAHVEALALLRRRDSKAKEGEHECVKERQGRSGHETPGEG